MKKTNLLLALILIFATNLLAQDDMSKAFWQSKRVVIDSDSREWEKPLNFYNDQSELLFTISNDSTNLYFCFSNNSEGKIFRMMRAGWQIHFSWKVKKKKHAASIAFPAVVTAMQEKKNEEGSLRNSKDFNDLINSYKLNLTSFTTTGFSTQNGILPINKNEGIRIGIGRDSTQSVVYEIAIPLKELFTENTIQLNEKLKVNIVINTMEKRPRNAENEEHNTGGMSGHRRGQGGYGGGGHRGNGGGNSPFEKISFEQEFRLTQK